MSKLTPCNRVLLEKLTDPQPVQKFPVSYRIVTEVSQPHSHSQVPATCPYPQPDQSSPGLLIPIIEDPF